MYWSQRLRRDDKCGQDRAYDRGLDFKVLEHCFHDEVAVGNVVQVGRRAHPSESLLSILRRELFLRNKTAQAVLYRLYRWSKAS